MYQDVEEESVRGGVFHGEGAHLRLKAKVRELRKVR